MIVGVHPMRFDGTRPPQPSPPSLPYGILIGPVVVTEHGVDHARRAPASSVRVLGRRSGDPACWCRLSGGPVNGVPAAPYEQLGAVLTHFGLTDLPR